MIEQKANGDIVIEIGNDGKPNKTQNLKLLRNGVLQKVVTTDELLAAINTIIGEGYTGTILSFDGTTATSSLVFTNGVLTDVLIDE